MNYPKDKMRIYLLDDPGKPESNLDLKAFCKKSGIQVPS